MLKLNQNLFVTDQEGNEVFMMDGDTISEISDAGPIEHINWDDGQMDQKTTTTGWSVSFRFTPSHGQWTEIVTCDAVKLLKALEWES